MVDLIPSPARFMGQNPHVKSVMSICRSKRYVSLTRSSIIAGYQPLSLPPYTYSYLYLKNHTNDFS